MKPILFAKDATSFNTNGLGRLDAISCVVTEERNGIFELEMEVAETAAHASEIEMDSIILAKPSASASNQAFRVYKMTKPINCRFKVYAQHLSYQLSFIPSMPFTVAISNTACNEALQGLKNNAAQSCPFIFWTDVNTTAGYTQSVPASIRNRLGGTEGSIIDQFGGEYEWDNYTVKLWKNRGLTIPAVSLRYGKNITDLDQEENISNTVTGVCPYWIDTEGRNIVTLPEKVVESQYADNFPFKRTIPYDCSQAFQTAPTEGQLRTHAQAYLNSSGIGVPSVSIKVSFLNLADTEEYKDIAALQNVNLCDKVGVYFEKLGINTSAKVVKTEYDVLAEKYKSVQIGSIRASLATTITDTNGAIETALDKSIWATKNATAWLTGSNGYVMAVKNPDGSWKELLFMSTNDATDPNANVLRVNENGLGFSSTGVNGPYTQAWTLDGKLVIGGTNVPSLTVYTSDNRKLFEVTREGIIWNVDNSQMDIYGNISANNASLTNATIKGGSLAIVQKVGESEIEIFKVSSNGQLRIQTLAGVTVFEVDQNGIYWNVSGAEQGVNYASSMTKSGHLAATGATFDNANINGGSLYQSNNGRFLQMVNGNIHGGYVGSESNPQCIIYLIYNIDNTSCITLGADGIGLDTSHLFIRDYRGGTYHSGYSGDVVTSGDVNTDDQTITVITGVDFENKTVDTETITFLTSASGDFNTKPVHHGILTDW